MNADECWEHLRAARVARLATIGPTGPHIVPCVYALVGSTIVTAVDHKPKRTRALARLANIERDPRVSLLVDHYDDDWDVLWWVRADGRARALDAGGAVDAARAALVSGCAAYR